MWSDKSPFSIAYWSPNLNTPPDWQKTPCVYIKRSLSENPGYWSYSDCHVPRIFVCEKKAHEMRMSGYKSTPVPGCSNGMVAWRSSCYWFIDESLNAYYGTSKCIENGGHAFDIEDLPELYFIKSLLQESQGETFWTGLNQLRAKGIFQWSHGEALHLNTKQLGMNLPTGYKVSTAGRCSYITMENGIQRIKLTKCSEKHKSLCEKLRIGYTTHIPWGMGIETTTVNPEICPYNNFKDYNGKCIMIYSTKTVSWRQAEEHCQIYGGHLLTYNTYKDNPAIYAKNSRDYWIGLQISPTTREVPNTDIRWADGTVVADNDIIYPHAEKEPLCAYRKIIYTKVTTFNFTSCSQHKKFICEINKGAELLPSPEIKDEEIVACPNGDDGWWEFNGYCYYHSANAKKSFEKMKVWRAANRSCIEKGGNLASIHNNGEAEFLVKLARERISSNKYLKDPWIGLRNGISTNKFFWSDQSLLNIEMWNTKSLFTYYMDRCVSLNNKNGHWDLNPCYMHRYYICKKFTRGPITTPKTPENIYKDCKNGWHQFGDKCFKFFKSLKPWKSADNICKTSYPETLASIRSQEEQDFLLLISQKHKFWIGLNDRENENNFVWSDGSDATYTNWATGEPNDDLNRIKEDCVLSLTASSKGKWNDMSCTRLHYFICQYYRESLKSTSAPTSKKSLQSFKCPLSMKKIGKHCFYISDEQQTYFNSIVKCFYLGGYLLSRNEINSFKRHLVMESNPSKVVNGYWFNNNNEKDIFLPLQWVDILKKVQKTGSKCELLSIKDIFKTTKCSEINPFVCQVLKDIPAALALPSPQTKCSKNETEGWFDFGGDKCYKLLDKTYRWAEARKICQNQGSNLVSFHSMNDLELISALVTGLHWDVWIGMLKNGTTGSSEWNDGSLADFFNWREGEPNKDDKKICGQMESTTLKWVYTYCYYSRHVICAADKLASSTSSSFKDLTAAPWMAAFQ